MSYNKELWTSIKDSMPISDEYVLVCLWGKFIKTSYFFKDSFGEWFSTDYDIWDQQYTDAVTHWMYLPDLPLH